MAESEIEWTMSSWNPVTGCTKFSSGCLNCYAEPMARRLMEMGQTKYVNGFKVTLHPESLDQPFKWKKPKVIFVNSMSDLFHQNVPIDFIEQVFDVMREAHWHTFQILTKRGQRLMELAPQLDWPDNVWMGVTVENTTTVDRIDALRTVPVNVRFLSMEPLLSQVPNLNLTDIHWVIAGGESGPRVRPAKKEWVQDIRDQCSQAKVAFFFKQWGGKDRKSSGRELDGQIYAEIPDLLAEKLAIIESYGKGYMNQQQLPFLD